ncbi:uncharacterized protein KY384_005960 [Bacidia gigantensis]|uniref:uncharacterized protein n=1 Tax=Bacidia gigantensis TaxID=2732470 RepID=UPI001D052BB5|nr:uncharacterized protein KY384_005960 [Bacidia gigantensis]KAG8529324.1 hypothetical protein KY384_005960 [Bacidia gigantensis]
MANPHRQNSTQLGATFVPGGVDDFYMPEVISPSPQRVTPEIPEKIQDNIAHLELEAEPVRRPLSGLQSPSPVEQMRNLRPASHNSSVSDLVALNGRPTEYSADQPSFSPFPPLRNRPPNIPQSDDEKEGVLEKARMPVLNCNDPEVQLSWAQDTLAYVDIATQYEARISQNQPARPQTPNVEHQLKIDAVNVVGFLADQRHPKADFLRGMWLEFGKFGFRMDKKEAFRCYQRAAQRGYARAEYRMGMQFENSSDPEKAIKHYRLGVDGGDSASNYRMGMMYLLGQHNQPLDYELGIKMISYAAETADENAPQGAYVFGMLQARALTQVSIPEQYLALNISGARYNIEKAAYLGFAKAQAKLGVAYELCQLGCDFNPAMSLHYNALAAKQGEPDADMSISKWFLCGYEGVFEKNEELAYVYAQRAAQSGLATAEFAMGYFFEVGIFVQADLKTSRLWYQKAADHGNKDAAGRIDGISRSKTLSRKDHEQVAVAKIQSQYGSQRGKRPERFKQLEQMPRISDSPVDMPEPKLPIIRPDQTGQAPYPSNAGQYAPGARPPSAAPYPLDDDTMQPRPLSRPVRNAYENQPPSRQNPPIPSASPAESEASYGDNNYRGSAFPTFKPSPLQTPHSGRGRGAPPPRVSTAAGLQNFRQPVSAHSSPHDTAPPQSIPQAPPKIQTPAIDIGFSAPPDPSGADRRRLQKLQDPAGSSRVSNTPPPSAPASTRLPGKGPKTFSEMGLPSQKQDNDCKRKNLSVMDQRISSLRDDIATLKSNEKLLRSNLLSVNATLSTQELNSTVHSLESDKASLRTRLGPLRKGDVKPVSLQEKAEVDHLHARWSKEAVGRKRIALELWLMVTEDLPEGMAKDDFWDALGLEGDA